MLLVVQYKWDKNHQMELMMKAARMPIYVPFL